MSVLCIPSAGPFQQYSLMILVPPMLAQWWKWIYLMDHVPQHVPGSSGPKDSNGYFIAWEIDARVLVVFTSLRLLNLPVRIPQMWCSMAFVIVTSLFFASNHGRLTLTVVFLWFVLSLLKDLVKLHLHNGTYCSDPCVLQYWDAFHVPGMRSTFRSATTEGGMVAWKTDRGSGGKTPSFILHRNMLTQSLFTPAEHHIRIAILSRVKTKQSSREGGSSVFSFPLSFLF